MKIKLAGIAFLLAAIGFGGTTASLMASQTTSQVSDYERLAVRYGAGALGAAAAIYFAKQDGKVHWFWDVLYALHAFTGAFSMSSKKRETGSCLYMVFVAAARVVLHTLLEQRFRYRNGWKLKLTKKNLAVLGAQAVVFLHSYFRPGTNT